MTHGKGAQGAPAPQHGVVVKFDPGRGYGFIRPDDGDGQGDVFVHIRNVSNAQLLRPGQRVSYELERTARGPAAVRVRAGSPLTIPLLGYPLLGIGCALLLAGVGALLFRPSGLAGWLALWSAALSVATFAIYRLDKAASAVDATRVPEAILLLLAALGGSPGAFAGMHIRPRHKTAKPMFQAIFWLIVAAQAGVLLLLVFQ